MAPIVRESQKSEEVLIALENLSKKWTIDPIIRDVHLGHRSDARDYPLKLNQVTFHIPKKMPFNN